MYIGSIYRNYLYEKRTSLHVMVISIRPRTFSAIREFQISLLIERSFIMHKRIFSSICFSFLLVSLCTTSVSAHTVLATTDVETLATSIRTNISSKYPNLKNPSKSDIKSVPFSEETVSILDDLIARLDTLEKTFNLKKLKGVFQDLFTLNTKISEEDVELHQKSDKINYVFYKASYLAFINTKGDNRDKLFIELADDMYLSAVNRINKGILSYLMRDYASYYGNILKEYFDDEKTKDILTNLNSMMNTVANTSIIPPDHQDINEGYVDYDYTFPTDELPSNVEADEREDNSLSFIPEYSKPLPPVKDDTVESEDDEIDYKEDYTEIIEYEGDYKVIIQYDAAGNEINRYKIPLTESEKVSLNLVQNPNVYDGTTWNQKAENTTNADENSIWDSLGADSLDGKEKISVYYTLNKDQKEPIYQDSGISLSSKKTVTYSQMQDILYCIVLKMDKSYLIEDTDKFLFIAEGKPLVIENKKSEFTKEEIINLLEQFKTIGLKVSKSEDMKQTEH